MIFGLVNFEMSMTHVNRNVKWTVWSLEDLDEGMNLGVDGM